MSFLDRKSGRERKNGWAIFFTLLFMVAFCCVVGGQTLLDHAMCRSLPPIDRSDEFLTTEKHAYSWIKLGPVTGQHSLTWKWYAPDGRKHREDGPVIVGNQGTVHSVVPVAQEFTILEDFGVTARPGQWRVDVYIDGVLLVTDEFSIVLLTQMADYGDAPDNQLCGYTQDPEEDLIGRFPTLFNTENSRIPGTPGAHALVVGEESLGDLYLTSREKDANDPDDPDLTPNLIDDDIDDGVVLKLLPSGLVQINVTIKVSHTSPPGRRYLNALYDLNRDGEWKETAQGKEWIVKNLLIDLEPGEESEIEIPIMLDQNWMVTLSEPRWLRVALTRERISETRYATVGGWDGSGQFSAGEIEDHKIGVAQAADIAWAVRSVYRRAWASARAQALALAWSLASAQAQVTTIASAYAETFASAQAADQAWASAHEEALAVEASYAAAQIQAHAYEQAFLALPCVVVGARAAASVEAALEAIAVAAAYARASAEVSAEASARALAWSRSAATALAHARATAVAFSAAVAKADARAEALAASWADARAWASALAQITSLGQLSAVASTRALAWVQANAWAYASAQSQASAGTWTLALTYVDTIAAALARAEAAALAAAEAEATAEAWAEAVTDVFTLAEVSLKAIVSAAAAIDAEVIEDCCEAEYCEDCPPVICPPCDSCCPDCPEFEPRICITAWIKTCKGTYRVGESITITYYVSDRARVKIVDYRSDGSSKTINLGLRNPGTYSFSGSVNPPAGPEVLVLTAEGSSGCSACAIAVFQVAGAEPKIEFKFNFPFFSTPEEEECD